MEKIILLSFVASTVAFPAYFARDRNIGRGLGRAVACIAVFNLAYALGLIYVWSRIR